ncbi:hypothetical protein FRC03_004801 [Tulasnella sp. 419]|nr:hypothetical protein FRC03_004801 [Tulasnella sp. 419]
MPITRFDGTNPTVLASLDLTHVLYDSTSSTSEALAIITLTPILLFASYAALIVFNRELTIINMLIGQLSNEALNYVIKESIQVERPFQDHGSGYGFPSSHSQYMGYFATFLIFHLLSSHTFPTHGYRVVDGIQTVAVCFALLLWAGTVAYSRYYLSYHTPLQIIGGLLVGSVFGVLHYYFTEYIPRRWPNTFLGRLRIAILDSTLIKWARVRDGWAVYPDGGHEDEWLAWRSRWEKQASKRKNASKATKKSQ